MPDITEVHKRGEWYTVVGYVNGRRVSGDIHAKDIEGKSESEKRRLFDYTVRTVDAYETKKY